MKKLAILSAIAFSGLVYSSADAQVRLHLGLHFGPVRVAYTSAPVVAEQAPVYDENGQAYDDNGNDDYYYLPDVDAYYSVNEQCYYYYDGDNWVSAEYLPGAYHDYNWRDARRYEVRAPRPYLHADIYRSRYNGRVAEWAHANYDNRNRGGFAAHANSDAYRGNDNRFDSRGRDDGRRIENLGNDQRFDNRGQGGFNQPSQPDREQQYQNHNNRGQSGFGEPSEPNRGRDNQNRGNQGRGGQGQPANQNSGHDREDRGGTDHVAQNSPQGGMNSHRMAKF